MEKGYRGLIVWQKAMDLVTEVYSACKILPKEELYALSDQMRRAVVSIPSNIAEGYMRTTEKDYKNFLAIASGSCAELETQILVCEKLGYLDSSYTNKLLDMTDEIGRILYGMRKKLTPKSEAVLTPNS